MLLWWMLVLGLLPWPCCPGRVAPGSWPPRLVAFWPARGVDRVSASRGRRARSGPSSSWRACSGFTGVVLAAGLSFRGDRVAARPWRRSPRPPSPCARWRCCRASRPGLFDNPSEPRRPAAAPGVPAQLLERARLLVGDDRRALVRLERPRAHVGRARRRARRRLPGRGRRRTSPTRARPRPAVVIGVVAVVGALAPPLARGRARARRAGGHRRSIVAAIRAAPEIARGSGGEGGGNGGDGRRAGVPRVPARRAAHRAARARAAAGAAAGRPRGARRPRASSPCSRAVAVGPALANRAWHSFNRPTPSLTGRPGARASARSAAPGARCGAPRSTPSPTHPLGGTGAGTFEFVWNRDPHRAYYVRDAHSLYLESLGELGLPGALLVLAALGCLLAAAVRTALREPDAAGAAAGAAAALLVYCVCAGVDWMWESTAVTAMALALGGLAAAAGARPARPLGAARRAGRARSSRRSSWPSSCPCSPPPSRCGRAQRAVRAGDVERGGRRRDHGRGRRPLGRRRLRPAGARARAPRARRPRRRRRAPGHPGASRPTGDTGSSSRGSRPSAAGSAPRSPPRVAPRR